MEIRILALILTGITALPAAPSAPVTKTYALDERVVYTIAVHREAPTTCLFPGTLGALEGAGVSARVEDEPAVLLAYQAGTNFFSVRALRENAQAALNVVFRGKAYVLDLTAAETPDRTVRFVERAEPESEPGKLDELLQRAKVHARQRAQQPGVLAQIERATPGTRTDYRGFSVTVEEVFRFDAEDVIVCRLRFDNAAAQPLFYDVRSLALRVGKFVLPAARVDATGHVPPHASAEAYLIVNGGADGHRAHLSVHETYQVLVARMP